MCGVMSKCVLGGALSKLRWQKSRETRTRISARALELGSREAAGRWATCAYARCC